MIEVESEEGCGTTFHIYLPLQEKSSEPEFEMEFITTNGHGETVLLVDDEAEILRTTGEVLKIMGYKVMKASDGEEALELFISNSDQIDLIISDVIMPKLGGIELARQIRQKSSEVPIIFVTGYDKEILMQMESGIEQSLVLVKPFAIEKLSHSIQILVEGK